VFNCVSMSLNFSLSAILGLECKCVNWLFCSSNFNFQIVHEDEDF